ncbi:MAG: glycosyltransferase [Candidatus Levybacteria bacterium]|nr:glycosyltransferase [Candidatus Levybacteria bacterium]
MKVALVYDRVNKWGGAERVLLMLHELFPDAPLYTSVYNPEKASWAKVFDVKTSFLQKFPKAASSHELYASLMPIAFESFSFDEYDLVISVTSEAAKGIITKPGTMHVCYCLTPTRYLWSGYKDYFHNQIFRLLSSPVVAYLRKWDKIASKRPDFYIAISKEVQKRIKKYYERESTVIYPPSSFGNSQSLIGNAASIGNVKRNTSNDTSGTNVKPMTKNGYFLIVSRLVPYKRIDVAIKAFNKLKIPLKIIGTGSQESYLKKIAGSTIDFLGNLTDYDLVEYYKSCSALIFPSNEDFGLVAIEAQGFGKPVIAFKDGGALEAIIEGKTGEFFYPQTEEAIIKVIQNFDSAKYDVKLCIGQADKFNSKRFKKQLVDFINNIL